MAENSKEHEDAPLLREDGNTNALHLITFINKIPVNHDTRIFRFALPSPNQVLDRKGRSKVRVTGVPVGQHVGLSAQLGPAGEEVVYFPCPEFPKGGLMTQHLERMREGDAINLRGPRGKLQYLGRGRFLLRADKDKDAQPSALEVHRVNLVAGGSGLAPMLQLLRAEARDSDCAIETSLLFANRHWQYDEGHITEEMLREHLFPPSEHTLTLMCGRKAMTRGLVQPLLESIGHDPSRIVKY
ncbi:hypothetical protein B566_EDAN014516 [Ephemera danica]|nr:hypothetical protein B566_EDAN014516 [Ephemera danica]